MVDRSPFRTSSLYSTPCSELIMKPCYAGFDGAKGLTIKDGHHRSLFRLKRGKTVPDPGKMDLKNQLLWFYPEGQESKLIYCNCSNQLFELDFIPTEPWMLLLETEVADE